MSDAPRAAGRHPTRDARLGQHWSLGQSLKNHAYFRLIRALLALADATAPQLLLASGRLLGSIAGRVLPVLAARAEQRAVPLLGPERARSVARDCFRHAGENLALMLTLRRPTQSALALVEVPSPALTCLRRALARGRGVVFVSAHLGPFELVAAALAELGLSPAVVVRESYDPRLDPLVDQHRMKRGVDVIHRGRPGAARRILRALAQGKPVGFLPDLPGRLRSTELRFLGSRAVLPVGPARIALRTGASVVAGTLARRGGEPRPGGLAAPFELVLEEVHVPGPGSLVAEHELMQTIMDALERGVLRSPADWLWMS